MKWDDDEVAMCASPSGPRPSYPTTAELTLEGYRAVCTQQPPLGPRERQAQPFGRLGHPSRALPRRIGSEDVGLLPTTRARPQHQPLVRPPTALVTLALLPRAECREMFRADSGQWPEGVWNDADASAGQDQSCAAKTGSSSCASYVSVLSLPVFRQADTSSSTQIRQEQRRRVQERLLGHPVHQSLRALSPVALRLSQPFRVFVVVLIAMEGGSALVICFSEYLARPGRGGLFAVPCVGASTLHPPTFPTSLPQPRRSESSLCPALERPRVDIHFQR